MVMICAFSHILMPGNCNSKVLFYEYPSNLMIVSSIEKGIRTINISFLFPVKLNTLFMFNLQKIFVALRTPSLVNYLLLWDAILLRFHIIKCERKGYSFCTVTWRLAKQFPFFFKKSSAQIPTLFRIRLRRQSSRERCNILPFQYQIYQFMTRDFSSVDPRLIVR